MVDQSPARALQASATAIDNPQPKPRVAYTRRNAGGTLVTRADTPTPHPNERASRASPSLRPSRYRRIRKRRRCSRPTPVERGLPLLYPEHALARPESCQDALRKSTRGEDTPTSREASRGVDVLFMVSTPEARTAWTNTSRSSTRRPHPEIAPHRVPHAFERGSRCNVHAGAHTLPHGGRIKASGMTYTFLRDSYSVFRGAARRGGPHPPDPQATGAWAWSR